MKAYIFSLLFICSASLASAQDFRGAFHLTQKEFNEQNDSLRISFDLSIDSRTVPSCAAMIFEPELKDDNNHQITFPYIQVNGETRSRLNRRFFELCSDKWLSAYRAPYLSVNTRKYTNEKITYFFSVPYESWMDNARLVLKQEIVGCGGEQYLYTYTLGDKVTMASREPYAVQPQVAIVTPGEEKKTRNRQGSAFLDFQSGRSVILPDFRRNPVELGKINDALNEVMADMDSQITGLFIEGYASPEGRYSSNERLARGRATALKEYIKTRYMLPEHIFTVRWIAEDWEGLKTAVESSELPRKDQLLQIIDSREDYDIREQRLKTAGSYSTLLKDFFPELRRVEYQIDFSVRNYNNVEARSLVNTNPGNLSQAELFRVAESYDKESPEYKRIIMEVIPKYYEEDATALSNAAALLIENGELNTALRLLEKAQTLPAAWNNLGVAYLLQGDLQRAEELLTQASTTGVKEANHNLEELKKRKEDELKRKKK
ncbi:DUF3868 domain-containing protein [Bacteroides sp. 224]|uniref:DUF3868 domain-containing protein n=1 Tax=Bacteroides sp. 224 TaxID=2302936 RepID=UPI0013D64ED1|nr:DUF3868 domain-containing protein [Bacteroides sp. 224]NDV67155.1 DUF3868 domain-containing protein [Bacteroides sp. 224]